MESLVCLVLSLLIPFSTPEFEPAYLKVCSSDFKQFVESSKCSRGIWLRKPIEPGCLCVRGAWALTNGFCDEKPVILVGDGHCYHIPFEIRSAKLIGDPSDPFKPTLFVAPMSLDAFYEITEGSFTPTLLSDSTLIVGVNPRQVAQRKDYSMCVDLDPKEYRRPLHIYLNPRRTRHEWTLDREKEYNCPSVTGYQHHIAFGELFSIGENKIEPKLLVARHCQDECPQDFVAEPSRNSSQLRRFQRMDSDRETNSEKISTAGGYQPPHRTRRPRVKTIEERHQEMEEMRASETMDLDQYEREVNEQTLRMMQAHISPLLLATPHPRVVTREYRYFQYIRAVVEKACPEEYVPNKVLKGMMRMFRQLLWETQETFQHTQIPDDNRFNRTLGRLMECSHQTPDPSVLFSTYNESYDPYDFGPDPKPERCPTPIIYAINGTFYNRTQNTGEARFLKNYTYYFPPHLKFNSSQVDFVIESAWKIAMIGHYRCSKYFDDEMAIEFSSFFNQIQSFFNYRIIKRWYYEKSVKATFDILKMTFPSYNLKKFMFGLDTCLFGTQGFSNYDWSNVWLQRPKVPHSENDLSQNKYVLEGATSLVDTRDFAPDRVKYLGSRGRRKREATGFDLWGQEARCIHDYMEPFMRHREFAYQLPSDCVPPQNPFGGEER